MSKLILPPSCVENIVTPKSDAIWTPKKELFFRLKKYVDVVMPPIFTGHMGFKGFYRLEATCSHTGKSRWLTDWFPNKITKFGLDRLRSSDQWNRAQVGTGTTPPDVNGNDTTLQTYLAGSGGRGIVGQTWSDAPLYYSQLTLAYGFATGATAGNISEIGIGPSPDSGSSLFSRELIRDAGGNPTTLTLTSSDTLTVYYSIRLYPPIVDTVATLNGTIGGSPASRTVTMRANGVRNDQISSWYSKDAYNTIQSVGIFAQGGYCGLNGSGLAPLATIPGVMGNTCSSVSNGSYTAGSFSVVNTATWDTGSGNGTWLTHLYCLGSTGYGSCPMQAQMDSPITKTNLQTLTVQYTVTWGEYTGP